MTRGRTDPTSLEVCVGSTHQALSNTAEALRITRILTFTLPAAGTDRKQKRGGCSWMGVVLFGPSSQRPNRRCSSRGIANRKKHGVSSRCWKTGTLSAKSRRAEENHEDAKDMKKVAKKIGRKIGRKKVQDAPRECRSRWRIKPVCVPVFLGVLCVFVVFLASGLG
jgi:hypothetical protein